MGHFVLRSYLYSVVRIEPEPARKERHTDMGTRPFERQGFALKSVALTPCVFSFFQSTKKQNEDLATVILSVIGEGKATE